MRGRVFVLTRSERALVFEAMDKIKKGNRYEISRIAQSIRPCSSIRPMPKLPGLR
jgi:hypothetical protein